MDDRLHTEKEIKSVLPVAVISEIPQIVNPADERSSKKRLALRWTTSALVLGVILAGSVFSFLHN
jgi:hypothetical protein